MGCQTMTKFLVFNLVIALSGVFITNAQAMDNEYDTSCPPRQSKLECQKGVAEWFKACAATVTHNGKVRNDADLNKCKEHAKKRNQVCQKTCSK